MGEIINTRASDYVNVSSSRIMNLLHLWLPWTWLPLTTLQASGSVWNSFQVGVIFFPLTFCSWGGPKEEAGERNITKYVLSPCLYVLFPQEKKADAGQGELANENVATAGSFWQWRPWSDGSQERELLVPHKWKSVLRYRTKSDHFFMCHPAISEELSLCWSPALESPWIRFKTTVFL